MQIHTEAFILSYLKYGDTSVILRIFTKELGYRTLIGRGFYSSKNKPKNLLLPLNKVMVLFKDKGNNSLDLLLKMESEWNPTAEYPSLEKNILFLFLAEMVNEVLKNEPPNPELYKWLDASLLKIHQSKDTRLLIQNFLLELTDFLGCTPQNEYSEGLYFDLESGHFSPQSSFSYLGVEDSRIWSNFLADNSQPYSASQRWMILQTLIRYYQIQISGFIPPKSMSVIKELFL